MITWELREQAITRVSSKGTKAEWVWCVLRDGETLEAYKDKDQAINRLDELRTTDES